MHRFNAWMVRVSSGANKRENSRQWKDLTSASRMTSCLSKKYGHCNVSQYGEKAHLGRWCRAMRSAYKNLQKNVKPQIKLSDEQSQRLNDAGFKWSQPLRALTKNIKKEQALQWSFGFQNKVWLLLCSESFAYNDLKQSDANNETIRWTDSTLERCRFQLLPTKGRVGFWQALQWYYGFQSQVWPLWCFST